MVQHITHKNQILMFEYYPKSWNTNYEYCELKYKIGKRNLTLLLRTSFKNPLTNLIGKSNTGTYGKAIESHSIEHKR
ncbi:hypothetical protein SAMN04488023_12041 [Pedobacter rhizosphaerae]|uniref:Uncharacterized protein n=1 Tax=Pedobacter rhizosphaerae TaxID=390241 RepID=A0A1H9T1K5_9SPHI|nr:hypothetical protein SAMN04488023_12041 [Pedobacter rhizosphaerae]